MARRKDPTKAGVPRKGPGKPGPSNPERAFDLWLDRGLHSMFDSVASEPIPEELLKLLEEKPKK